jgi:hypothetical protein
MLFFKTKENTEEAALLQEPPRAPRYATVARVCINGFEGEAVLRNISSGGFRMESRTYAAITVGERHTMQIKPEKTSALQAFELEVEARWVQSSETSFNSGFLIIKPPADKSFENYINYIARRL